MKFVTLTLAVFLIPWMTSAAGVSIQLQDGAFHVTGLASLQEPADGWRSVFAVYAGQGKDLPPMLGSYSLEGGALVFHPRFPLTPGLQYRAVYDGTEALFDGPQAPKVARAHVERVYPSASVLPSNQLKLYVYFSQPMSRGGVWNHIHWLDENGRPVDLAFLEIEQELWDAGNRRLTILFDPGRIKRGVRPHEESGSAVVEGKRYALQIDAALPDASGQPLTRAFRREFRGGPAIRTGIDLKQWKLEVPHAGSRAALAIAFPRPLDYAILSHAITVQGPHGQVTGTAQITGEETGWQFTPDTAWEPGDYHLVIDMTLEDLAGNRIGRPFDVDTVHAPAPRITSGTATLPFPVR